MEGLDLQKLLRIARRRLWLWLPILCIGLTGSVVVAYFLPSIYRASAFILVEGQKIPEEYVQSTVTTDIQNRLHTISQEILSRSRLEELIKKYDLYPKLRAEASLQEVIAAMRSDIGIEIRNVNRRQETSVAFEVSYRGTNAETVTLVANRLASFYIEENLKIREQQAIGTTNFITEQLRGVQKQLEEQEERISQFKRQHLGELPEQLNANLATLTRLQAQLELNSDNLIKARERRDLLLRELGQYRKAETEQTGENGKQRSTVPAIQEGGLEQQIDEMTRSLAILKSRFSEKHPDVIRAAQELEALTENQTAPTDELTGEPVETPRRPRDPYLVQVQSQIREADSEIRFLTQDIKQTREAIQVYEKRIEETPRREQEVISLTRDYKSTQELYASLLKRKEEAELATSMEQRQKGERFRIIDPAIRPSLPEGPKRLLILAMGFALAAGLGGGAVFLLEMLNKSFASTEELEKVTDIPILVSISTIRTRTDRRWAHFKTALATLVLISTIGGVAAASYYVAKGNEPLVKSFTGSSGGQTLR